MEQASGAEHERLDALIGRWKTDGQTKETPGAPWPRSTQSIPTSGPRRVPRSSTGSTPR